MNVLNKSNSDFEKLAGNASYKRIDFLERLTNIYNIRNFSLSAGHPSAESSESVLKIFKNTKKVTNSHLVIVDNHKGTLGNLGNVLDFASKSKVNDDFVKRMQEIFAPNYNKKNNSEIILDVINSKNAKEIVNNFDNYESYLKLKVKDDKAVSKLNHLIEIGDYDANRYKKLHVLKKSGLDVFATDSSTKLTKKALSDNYSPEKMNFLETLHSNGGVKSDVLKDGGDDIVLDMYKSTTSKNLNMRNYILRNTTPIKSFSSGIAKQDLVDLNKLFKTIDEDKHAKQYVKASITSNSMLSVHDYNELFENIEPKKLNIFKENSWNIINQVDKSNRVEVLAKEIENPFFLTENTKRIIKSDIKQGYRKPESF